MKTTVDIDRDLLDEAKRVTGMKTYRATVEHCLRVLLEIYRRKADPATEASAPRAE